MPDCKHGQDENDPHSTGMAAFRSMDDVRSAGRVFRTRAGRSRSLEPDHRRAALRLPLRGVSWRGRHGHARKPYAGEHSDRARSQRDRELHHDADQRPAAPNAGIRQDVPRRGGRHREVFDEAPGRVLGYAQQPQETRRVDDQAVRNPSRSPAKALPAAAGRFHEAAFGAIIGRSRGGQ